MSWSTKWHIDPVSISALSTHYSILFARWRQWALPANTLCIKHAQVRPSNGISIRFSTVYLQTLNNYSSLYSQNVCIALFLRYPIPKPLCAQKDFGYSCSLQHHANDSVPLKRHNQAEIDLWPITPISTPKIAPCRGVISTPIYIAHHWTNLTHYSKQNQDPISHFSTNHQTHTHRHRQKRKVHMDNHE